MHLTPSACLYIHALSLVLVAVMKSKEFKTKIYSHAHSLILPLPASLPLTLVLMALSCSQMLVHKPSVDMIPPLTCQWLAEGSPLPSLLEPSSLLILALAVEAFPSAGGASRLTSLSQQLQPNNLQRSGVCSLRCHLGHVAMI